MEICGIVDDVWVDSKGEFHIVDYKSTSTSKEINLDDEYKQGYKRQVEWYQWIFRRLGHKVSDTAYFVFANGIKGNDRFDGKLEFDLEIIPYKGNDSWVKPTIVNIKKCLETDELPDSGENCEYCRYRALTKKAEASKQKSIF